MRKVIGVVLFVAMGCGDGGDGGGGGGGGGPTSHLIASDQPFQITNDEYLVLGPFPVPSGATVTYSVVDTPTGVGQDTFDVTAVASDASVDAGTFDAIYGVREGVNGSVSATTQPLPAGTYDFVALCGNIIDDCVFRVTLTAYY